MKFNLTLYNYFVCLQSDRKSISALTEENQRLLGKIITNNKKEMDGDSNEETCSCLETP